MKLITEYTESNLECLVEKNDAGEKQYKIQGIFAQTDKKNRNGRVYPKDIMERAVAKYDKEQIQTCLLYTSPSPRDNTTSRMPSSA